MMLKLFSLIKMYLEVFVVNIKFIFFWLNKSVHNQTKFLTYISLLFFISLCLFDKLNYWDSCQVAFFFLMPVCLHPVLKSGLRLSFILYGIFTSANLLLPYIKFSWFEIVLFFEALYVGLALLAVLFLYVILAQDELSKKCRYIPNRGQHLIDITIGETYMIEDFPVFYYLQSNLLLIIISLPFIQSFIELKVTTAVIFFSCLYMSLILFVEIGIIMWSNSCTSLKSYTVASKAFLKVATGVVVGSHVFSLFTANNEVIDPWKYGWLLRAIVAYPILMTFYFGNALATPLKIYTLEQVRVLCEQDRQGFIASHGVSEGEREFEIFVNRMFEALQREV